MVSSAFIVRGIYVRWLMLPGRKQFFVTNQLQFYTVLKTNPLRYGRGVRWLGLLGVGPDLSDVFLLELGLGEEVYFLVGLLEGGGRGVDEVEESVEPVVGAEVAGVELEGVIFAFLDFANQEMMDVYPIELHVGVLQELEGLHCLLGSGIGWEFHQPVGQVVLSG